MPFKLSISENTGKAYKLESDSDSLVGKKLGEIIKGKELSPELSGYELQITGASDIAGFPQKKDVDGPELKRVLLKKGWGMHRKPKREGKKKVQTPHGLRLRKTVRGNQISDKTVQININVLKQGSKKLSEIFPEQNVPKAHEEKPAESSTISQPETQPDGPKEKAEEIKEEIAEEIKEEVKDELKESIPTSPETKTPEAKEEAAEKVAEEVAEEVEEAVEEIADEETKTE